MTFMMDDIPPRPPPTHDDQLACSADKVSTLLKMATWYVRLGNPRKVERLLALAVDLVENHGGIQDASLNRLLDKYADSFRRLQRPVEAGRLAELAQRIRAGDFLRFASHGCAALTIGRGEFCVLSRFLRPTVGATRFSADPKGRNVTAQGAALGNRMLMSREP